MVTTATIAHTLKSAPVRLIVAHISAPKRNTAKKIAPHSNRFRLTSILTVRGLMSAECVHTAPQVKGHQSFGSFFFRDRHGPWRDLWTNH